MEYTYEQLSKKTVAELREIASGLQHEALQGYTQLNKDHLLPALCKALGIDAHEHHQVVGIDKGKIKAEIRQLKTRRSQALEAKDYRQLREIRRQIRALKRKIRKAMR